MIYGLLMMFVFMDIEPVLASSLPTTVAPELSVIEFSASMFPLKDVPAPIVAEAPVCQ